MTKRAERVAVNIQAGIGGHNSNDQGQSSLVLQAFPCFCMQCLKHGKAKARVYQARPEYMSKGEHIV